MLPLNIFLLIIFHLAINIYYTKTVALVQLYKKSSCCTQELSSHSSCTLEM